MNSVRVDSQKKEFRKELPDGSVLVAHVRYDDECKNGHNTFAITADLYDRDRSYGEAWVMNFNRKKRYLGSYGCLHDLVAEHFPELARYIKWHLTSSDGPMHYVANTIFWATPDENGNEDIGARYDRPRLALARKSAVWPDATLEQLSDRAALEARLPALLEEFRKDVESLGFVF